MKNKNLDPIKISIWPNTLPNKKNNPIYNLLNKPILSTFIKMTIIKI